VDRPPLAGSGRASAVVAGAASRTQSSGHCFASNAGPGLDLESTLRRIVETAVELVDATYGA